MAEFHIVNLLIEIWFCIIHTIGKSIFSIYVLKTGYEGVITADVFNNSVLIVAFCILNADHKLLNIYSESTTALENVIHFMTFWSY